MPRPKKKPNYDPEIIMQELMDTVVSAYLIKDGCHLHPSLAEIAQELSLNPMKVRKLLITAGVRSGRRIYESTAADEVLQLYEARYSVEEIMARTGLSRASVHSYLPYTKIAYKTEEISLSAERIRKYRERKKAEERLKKDMTSENLWSAVTAFAGYPFHTAKGLKFTYRLKGNEMFVDRKEKSITRATVELAFAKALELGEQATGPKMLGCFGASYLYPIFVRLGVINK